jgi:hypothetical protein
LAQLGHRLVFAQGARSHSGFESVYVRRVRRADFFTIKTPSRRAISGPAQRPEFPPIALFSFAGHFSFTCKLRSVGKILAEIADGQRRGLSQTVDEIWRMERVQRAWGLFSD